MQSINNDTGRAIPIPFYSVDTPFVYTKDLLTSVKWKAEDGEISVEVDIFPNAAKSGWTKGLLTWAKFILRQMSSTAKYRFKSMSIQLPLFSPPLFFSWAPVCSALPSGFVYIVGRRVGAWKWKMKGGGKAEKQGHWGRSRCLASMNGSSCTWLKNKGGGPQKGKGARWGSFWAGCVPFIFRHIDVSAINIISILLHILFHAMFSFVTLPIFFQSSRAPKLYVLIFSARATSGHITCQSIWKSPLTAWMVITKKINYITLLERRHYHGT